MKVSRQRTAAALAALMMAAATAASAQVVYIPPGAYPRFGGDIGFGPIGPVAGFWPTECRTWHIRTQQRRGGAPAPPELHARMQRFVSGLIMRKPPLEDMSPEMVKAVQKELPTFWPTINRMGPASSARKVDVDDHGNEVYVVDQAGGATHWNIAINRDGLIDGAFICAGTGD